MDEKLVKLYKLADAPARIAACLEDNPKALFLGRKQILLKAVRVEDHLAVEGWRLTPAHEVILMGSEAAEEYGDLVGRKIHCVHISAAGTKLGDGNPSKDQFSIIGIDDFAFGWDLDILAENYDS